MHINARAVGQRRFTRVEVGIALSQALRPTGETKGQSNWCNGLRGQKTRRSRHPHRKDRLSGSAAPFQQDIHRPPPHAGL